MWDGLIFGQKTSTLATRLHLRSSSDTEGDRSFTVVGRPLWNNLPVELWTVSVTTEDVYLVSLRLRYSTTFCLSAARIRLLTYLLSYLLKCETETYTVKSVSNLKRLRHELRSIKLQFGRSGVQLKIWRELRVKLHSTGSSGLHLQPVCC